ncbi:MAG: hypothetical protein GYA55_13035 [SAR324 cluster bacterium]|uniref:4Fe4S-binding SPASM domain-containing protein n=1 Tax=SAR324 cluster bacterium TaxID=2024889 RepID=A0A7X9FTY4_9DELT|nr:hypothetical protein [SAR324 cluster bacterium]
MKSFEEILKQIISFCKKMPLPLISFAAYNEPSMDPFFIDRLMLLNKFGFTYWWISNASCMTNKIQRFLREYNPKITNFHINMPSCEPERLSKLVGITQFEAQKHIKSMSIFLEENPKLAKRVLFVVHGDGSPEHKQDFQRVLQWATVYSAKAVQASLVNRAGMLKGVGTYVEHSYPSLLFCGAHYTSNIYIGVEGNVYLCCHDYYKKTSFGNLKDQSLQCLLSCPQHKVAEKMLKDKFCRYCVFALGPWARTKNIIARASRRIRRAFHLAD